MNETGSAKRVRWSLLAAIGLMVVLPAALLVLQPTPPTSPWLDTPVGRVRIHGVTYGTNHILGPPLARLVARLPMGVQDLVQDLCGRQARVLGSMTMSPAGMVVWLDRNGPARTAGATNVAGGPAQAADGGWCEASLADASGFVSGETSASLRASPPPGWDPTEPLRFNALPRRDLTNYLAFFYHSSTGGVVACGRLAFANPVYAAYPQWTPEALPAVKRFGNIEAILDKLSTGHGDNVSYGPASGGQMAVDFDTNRQGGRNTTVCFLRLRTLDDTHQAWTIASTELSDATGNRLPNSSLSWGGFDEGYFTFGPALWPSESAWKLACEIKRTRGFAPEETVAFRGVPLGSLDATNRVALTTNFQGVSLTLATIVRRSPNTNSAWSTSDLSRVVVMLSGMTNGQHLDLLEARADNGTNLECCAWSNDGTTRDYSFRTIPLAARTADFTFALQHGRWVDFTVRPEVGPARLLLKK